MRPIFTRRYRQVMMTLVLSCSVLISSLGVFPGNAMAAGRMEFITAPNQPQLMALFGTSRAEQLDNMAKTDIDKTFGRGTSTKAEGAVQQAQGKAQQDIQTTQSAFKKVPGKAKQDMGRTQNAIGNLEQNIESAAEDAQDTVKELFD